MTTKTFEKNLGIQIERYMNGLKIRTDKYFEAHYHNLIAPDFTAKVGKRYVKIIKSTDHGDDHLSNVSVHSFIDMTNGDILMAASWKAPAKHARGNVFDADNGMGATTIYGANYLK